MKRIFVTLTAAIALIGTTGLLAGPALALRPQTFSFEFEDSFTDRRTCGFRVLLRFTGSIRGTEYFDRDGSLIRVQLHGEDLGTATNPKNGKTASGSDAWLEVTDVRRDGHDRRAVLPPELSGCRHRPDRRGQNDVRGRLRHRLEAGPHQDPQQRLHGALRGAETTGRDE